MDETIYDAGSYLNITRQDVDSLITTKEGVESLYNKMREADLLPSGVTVEQFSDKYSAKAKAQPKTSSATPESVNEMYNLLSQGLGMDINEITAKIKANPNSLLEYKSEMENKGFLEKGEVSDSLWAEKFGFSMSEQTPASKTTTKTNSAYRVDDNGMYTDKETGVKFKDYADLSNQVSNKQEKADRAKTEDKVFSQAPTLFGQTTGAASEGTSFSEAEQKELDSLKLTLDRADKNGIPKPDNAISADRNLFVNFETRETLANPSMFEYNKKKSRLESEIKELTGRVGGEKSQNRLNTVGTPLTDTEQKDLKTKKKELEEHKNLNSAYVIANATMNVDEYIQTDRELTGRFIATGADARAAYEQVSTVVNSHKSIQSEAIEELDSRLQTEHTQKGMIDYYTSSDQLNKKSEAGKLTQEDLDEHKRKFDLIIKDPKLQQLNEIYRQSGKTVNKESELLLELQDTDLEAYKDVTDIEDAILSRDTNGKGMLNASWDFVVRGLSRGLNSTLQTAANTTNFTVPGVSTSSDLLGRLAREAKDMGDFRPTSSRAQAGITQSAPFDYLGKSYKAIYEDGKVIDVRDEQDYSVATEVLLKNAALFTSEKEAKRDISWYSLANSTADVILDIAIDVAITKGTGMAMGGTKTAYSIGQSLSAYSRGYTGTYNELIDTPGMSTTGAHIGAGVMGIAAAGLTKINPMESRIAQNGLDDFLSSYSRKNVVRLASGKITAKDVVADYAAWIAKAGISGGKETLEEVPEDLIKSYALNPVLNKVYGTKLTEGVSANDVIETAIVSFGAGILGAGIPNTPRGIRNKALEIVAGNTSTFIDFAEGLAESNPDMAANLSTYISTAKELEVLAPNVKDEKVRVEIMKDMLKVRDMKDGLAKMTISTAVDARKEQIKTKENAIVSKIEKFSEATIKKVDQLENKKVGSDTRLRAYDFDGTLFTDGKLTTIGREVKKRIEAGEDIKVVTAREATNTQEIKDALGIKDSSITATGDESLKLAELQKMGINTDEYYDSDKTKLDNIRNGITNPEQDVTTPIPALSDVESTAKALEGTDEKSINAVSKSFGFPKKFYHSESEDGGYHQSLTNDVMVNSRNADTELTFYLKGVEPDTKRGGKGSHALESPQGEAIYFHEVGHKMFSKFSELGHEILNKLKAYNKTDDFGHPTAYSAITEDLFDATMMDFYSFYKLHPKELKSSQPKAYDLMKEWEQKYISEAYHSDKATGKETELTKAVESLFVQPTEDSTPSGIEQDKGEQSIPEQVQTNTLENFQPLNTKGKPLSPNTQRVYEKSAEGKWFFRTRDKDGNLGKPTTVTQQGIKTQLDGELEKVNNQTNITNEKESSKKDGDKSQTEEGEVDPTLAQEEEVTQTDTQIKSVVTKIKNRLKQLPKLVRDLVTVKDRVPKYLSENTKFSIQKVFDKTGVNITNPELKGWLGVFRGYLNLFDIESEADLENKIEGLYNSLKDSIIDYPKYTTISAEAKKELDRWIKALDEIQIPIQAKHAFLHGAAKELNITQKRRSGAIIPPVNAVVIQTAYNMITKNPSSYNRAFQVYKESMIAAFLADFEQIPSSSGNGFWVKIPRTKKEDKNFKKYKKRFKAVSPKQWCTASGHTESYLTKYDNYLLVVKGAVIAGIEVEKGEDADGKRIVKDVTNTANESVASIKYLKETLDFMNDENLSTNDRAGSINRAKKYAQQNLSKEELDKLEYGDGEDNQEMQMALQATTVEEAIEVISLDANNYEFLNEQLKGNIDVITFAIESDPSLIEDVKKKHLRLIPNVLLAAVESLGNAIQYIPKELITEEIALEAATQDGEALIYVPRPLRTAEVSLAAVTQNGRSLVFVPSSLRTKEMYLVAVTQTGSALEHVPEVLITEEMMLAAVNQNGRVLSYIPEKLITARVSLAAVTQDGAAIKYVPDGLITEEIALKAVTQNGYSLQHVPDKLITAEIALAAVTQYGESLYYVPKELITEEIALVAVTYSGYSLKDVPKELITARIVTAALTESGDAIEYIPKELRVGKVALAMVSVNGNNIRSIPSELRTAEIYLAAVTKEGRALTYIPDKLITAEIALAAVTQNGLSLQYVPKELITEEIALVAVTNSGSSISYVPDGLITAELALAAVTQNGNSISYVPEELQTEEMLLAAVTQNGSSLAYISYELITTELAIAAVTQEGNAIQYIPKELITEELMLTAVTQYGRALYYVPEELITEELALAAVTQDGNALSYLPDKLITAEIALAAVTQNGRALYYVPRELRTAEVALAAVTQDGYAISTVPEELRTAEIYLAAVTKEGNAITYVPRTLITAEIALAAVTQNGSSLYYVPEGLKTPELRRVAEESRERDRIDINQSKSLTGTEGYYDSATDEVVIIAENTNPQDAIKIAIHELSHRGMAKMAKELGGFDKLYNALSAAKNQLMEKSEELLKRSGYTSVEELISDYGFDINTKEGELELLMELAARWAETFETEATKPNWWKNLITNLKAWISEFTGKELTEAEVDELVRGFTIYGALPREEETPLQTVLQEIGKTEAEIVEQIYKFFTSRIPNLSEIQAREFAQVNYNMWNAVATTLGKESKKKGIDYIRSKVAQIGSIATVEEATGMSGDVKFDSEQSINEDIAVLMAIKSFDSQGSFDNILNKLNDGSLEILDNKDKLCTIKSIFTPERLLLASGAGINVAWLSLLGIGLYGDASTQAAINRKLQMQVYGRIISDPSTTNIFQRKEMISDREVTFSLDTQYMPGVKAIIGGEFVEGKNNSVRTREEWESDMEGVFSDKKIPVKNITYFYGVEDGKLKVAELKEFKKETTVVANRFLKKDEYIGKVVDDDGGVRLLNKDGGVIYTNFKEMGKALLYDRNTGEAIFLSTSKNNKEQFLKNVKEFVKDREVIPVVIDNGRFVHHTWAKDGFLTPEDYVDYFSTDYENLNIKRYNILIK